jgi:hypothetical protein
MSLNELTPLPCIPSTTGIDLSDDDDEKEEDKKQQKYNGHMIFSDHAWQRMEQRHIPVSLIEQELSQPHTTDVTVICAGRTVITVYLTSRWERITTYFEKDILTVSSMVSNITNLHARNIVSEQVTIDHKFNRYMLKAQKAARQERRMVNRSAKFMSTAKFTCPFDGRLKKKKPKRMLKKYFKCFSVSFIEGWNKCNYLARRHRGRRWINSYQGEGNVEYQRHSQSSAQFIQNPFGVKYKYEREKPVNKIIKKVASCNMKQITTKRTVKSPSNEEHKCCTCGRSFKSIGGLNSHCIAKHEKVASCNMKQITTKRTVKNPWNEEHKCCTCGRSFKSREGLNSHCIAKHEKVASCNMKQITTKRTVKSPSNEEHKCCTCGRSFKSRRGRNSHCIAKHKSLIRLEVAGNL